MPGLLQLLPIQFAVLYSFSFFNLLYTLSTDRWTSFIFPIIIMQFSPILFLTYQHIFIDCLHCTTHYARNTVVKKTDKVPFLWTLYSNGRETKKKLWVSWALWKKWYWRRSGWSSVPSREDNVFKSPEVGRSLTSSKNTEKFRTARDRGWH